MKRIVKCGIVGWMFIVGNQNMMIAGILVIMDKYICFLI